MAKIFGKKVTHEKLARSYWPGWVSRLFETLKEIPWLSLTATSTFFGALILFSYFRSIDHFPSDFSSLVTLGAATAVCSVALICALAFGLFAPAAVYQQYATKEKGEKSEFSKVFSEYELVCLQFGGVGWVFSYSGYSQYRDCETFSWYGIFGFLLFLLGFIAFLRIVWRGKSWGSRFHDGFIAIAVAVLTVAPFLMLIPLKEVLTFPGFDSSIALLALWALAILANASVGRLRGSDVAVIAIVLVGVLYICVPLAIDQPSFFPKMVASYLGVRGERPQDIRVPKKTCELIKSSLPGNSGEDLFCSDGNWSKVSAQILSNVGEHWLIELSVPKNSIENESSRIRLTIPRIDVQVVTRMEKKTSTEKSISCAK